MKRYDQRKHTTVLSCPKAYFSVQGKLLSLILFFNGLASKLTLLAWMLLFANFCMCVILNIKKLFLISECTKVFGATWLNGLCILWPQLQPDTAQSCPYNKTRFPVHLYMVHLILSRISILSHKVLQKLKGH